MPYHFFLAAVGSRKSTLHALLGGADGLVEKLERYYRETGQLQKAEVPPTVWARVWAYWRGRRSA